MESHIWVVPVPPVESQELAALLGIARQLGVDARPVDYPESGCLASPGRAALIALRMENGLWLFWIDGDRALPRRDETVPSAGSFALRCSAIFAWPQDRARFEDWLACKAPGAGGVCETGDAGRCGTTGADRCGTPGADQGDDARVERGEETFRRIGLVGRSRRFREALCLAVRLARYDVPVLLEGETGTGKELFARALHYFGPRQARPFVPLNCGALPDTLLESQLFGHMRGAFTDARSEMRGLVAQAEGGTLFFDEVHCLSPKGQVTLLRFLQDQLFRPLGAEQLRRADVRIVAATNCALEREVAEGRFREDLYYRIKVAAFRLPPLRERREDIPLLVEAALARLCARFETGPRQFDAASLVWLATREWRGNVRELENFVCRAFLLSDDPVLHVDFDRGSMIDSHEPSDAASDGSSEGAAGRGSAAANLPGSAAYKTARSRMLSEFDSHYLRTMLSLTHGNVTLAARQAGKERRVFGRMLRKHGIDRSEFR